MSARCPGWRADGTFDPEECRNDRQHDEGPGHEVDAECHCTNWCGDPGEAGCCHCNNSDVYMPCPVVGFACGLDGDPTPCDCCTPEQYAAALAGANAR